MDTVKNVGKDRLVPLHKNNVTVLLNYFVTPEENSRMLLPCLTFPTYIVKWWVERGLLLHVFEENMAPGNKKNARELEN